MKILIADDNAHALRFLGGKLRDWGHEVVHASDGLAAMRALCAEPPPELVLVDWLMPGMDGASVTRWIRANLTAPPPWVVILSARGGVSLAHNAQLAGANGVLAKPWSDDQLRTELRVAGAAARELRRSRAAAAGSGPGPVQEVAP